MLLEVDELDIRYCDEWLKFTTILNVIEIELTAIVLIWNGVIGVTIGIDTNGRCMWKKEVRDNVQEHKWYLGMRERRDRNSLYERSSCSGKSIPWQEQH